MALVPFAYNLRSLFVRRVATALTVVGIGATVAVVAGVLSLQQGFATLFATSGRGDLAVFLRPGATSEGESAYPRAQHEFLIKSTPEIAQDAAGRPLASAELYLAVRLRKFDGGETNVPIRGVQPATFALRGEEVRVVEGRRFEPGTDEILVGRALVDRIQGARPGEVIVLNTTPFRVTGVFAQGGPLESEIWGDLDRLSEALERPFASRVLAKLRANADVAAMAERLRTDPRVPSKVLTERDYLAGQTGALSQTLFALVSFLAVVMGTAAVFTGTNTMLAAIAARAHEIGVLLSLGFRPVAIFLSFLGEAVVLGLLGGAVGTLLVLPLHGLRTGTTNYNTFTEVAFAFRVTPAVLLTAVVFSVTLGLLGGAWPAWRASRLDPTDAMRKG